MRAVGVTETEELADCFMVAERYPEDEGALIEATGLDVGM